MKFVRPPKFWSPRPQKRTRGMVASSLAHCVIIAALTWLPVVLPSPVVKNPAQSSELAQTEVEPLLLPKLPQLEDRGSGASAPGPEAPPAPVRRGARPAPTAEAPAQLPDFIAPQRIESFIPNAVNRVQTIQRPDLVAPPKLKFPMRLQAQVNLPAAVPVLDAPPPEKPRPAPDPAPISPEEIPVAKATVEKPVVTLTPQRTSAIRKETAPAKTVAPSLRVAAGTNSDSLKSVVVLNAVNVVADAAPVPDAELAGNFAVGPAPGAATNERSSGTGREKSSTNSNSNSDEGSPSGSATGGTGVDSTSGPPAPVSGHGTGPGNSSAPDSHRNGSGMQIIGGTGNGGGSGGGPGRGSGSGAAGRGSGNGSSTGISISGGASGRTSGTVAGAPMPRSYGMMVISGGNNGGASRDMGVFSRNETVYSVTIPMAGAGGGPDWTMQYALSDPAQASAGMLVPPFVEKKVGAVIPKSQLTGDPGPVFVTGTIDEKGKMRALRCILAQDPRGQAAVRALEQWEFLPAQLDGKPVATKVLIGVKVSTVE